MLGPGTGVAGRELAVVVPSPKSSLVDMGFGISNRGMQECQENFSWVARAWVQKTKCELLFLDSVVGVTGKVCVCPQGVSPAGVCWAFLGACV